MTPQEQAIAALLQAGWVARGTTPQQHVRIPTRRSPVFGGVGGEARTLGGRPRFHLPGTERFATVGARTACFYRIAQGQATDTENIRTKDLQAIKAQAERTT